MLTFFTSHCVTHEQAVVQDIFITLNFEGQVHNIP